MKTRSRLSLLALAVTATTLIPATVAQAALPGAVSVRVEGSTVTRVAATRVDTTSTPITVTDRPGTGTDTAECSGTSALAALNTATAGSWSGDVQSFGPTVEVIDGESHTFDSGRYWTFWVNEKPAELGACQQELSAGDSVLFFVTCFPASDGCPDGALVSSVPATARPGQTVSLLVKQAGATYDDKGNSSVTNNVAAGAAVQIGAATTASAADGTASVTLGDARGPQAVTIEKAGFARFTASVCVTDGADGQCGSVRPIPGITTGGDEPGCVHAGNDGRCGTPDRVAPLVKLAGFVSGKHYRQSKAPRELRGVVANFPNGERVADASGLKDVRVRITRYFGGRCWSYNGTKERFTTMRSCDKDNGQFFSVGNKAEWTYLLPQALAPGKYRIEAHAIDGKGNVDRSRRKISHLVFSVR